MKYAKVIVDISHEKLDKTFQYIIPEELADTLRVGMQVSIPFGNAKRRGYVVELTDCAEYPPELLKELNGVVKKSVTASGQLIELAWWMKEQYGCTMNQALKTVIPVKKEVKRRKSKIESVYEQEDFAEEISVNPQIVLNKEQRQVTDDLCAALGEKEPGVHLLFGVTGSGKTEIYLEVLQQAIAKGKQAIVLIPEISLTYQTILRFRRRFGNKVAVINSKMSAGEKYENFEKAKKGEISIMVGPRSAVFTPFPHLGLVIMDEEHEGAYKSEQMPKYHAREVAIKRARMNGAMVILGSATPSLESYYRVKNGVYQLHVLKKRGGEGTLPDVSIVDLRAELLAGNRTILSLELKEKIQETLEKKQQIMLFLNRRGYSGFVSCRSCGEVFTCPHCSVSLNAHRGGVLKCHYCGHRVVLPKLCPKCGSPYIGSFGTGTQKVEEFVKKQFPDAKVLRMDLDTTSGKEGHEKILAEFRSGTADILVGTQMIVKGHDFANVTLVGILAADLSLFYSDYGAAERTFQLLTQAAGRAGRGRERGQVVIQTYRPEHYSVVRAAAQDYEGFFADEMAFRRMMHYPPYHQMAAFVVTSEKEEEARGIAAHIHHTLQEFKQAQQEERLTIIGPVEATIAKVKDKFRMVIYLKHEELQVILRAKDAAIAAFDTTEKTDSMLQFDLSVQGTI
ncbi:MAG: primosomal protein N' [Lachnospiraceae bacterium]|nr:primosomal protein N' [Lachnospiraceae bacterium]